MVSACMVTNTVGKVLMGWLCDTFGARNSILAFTAAVMASIACLLVVRAPWAHVATASLFGLTYARVTFGLTMLNRECFDGPAFNAVCPMASLCRSFSNAVFSSRIGYAYDATGGYTVSLLFFMACIITSAAIVIWCYRRTGQTKPTTV